MNIEPTDTVSMICGGCWEAYREAPSSLCTACQDVAAGMYDTTAARAVDALEAIEGDALDADTYFAGIDDYDRFGRPAWGDDDV